MRRSPRILVVSVAALALLATTPLVAAASTGTRSKPPAWAKTVCTSVTRWLESIESAVADTATVAPTTPAEGKEALVGLVRRASKATKKLVKQVKKASPPTVDGGKQLGDSVVDQLKQVQTTMASALEAVKQLPEDDPVAFVAESRAAQDSLEAGMESVQQALRLLTDLDEPTLVTAFNEQSACQDVTA